MNSVKTKADEILGKIQVKEEVQTPEVDTSDAQTSIETAADTVATDAKQVASDAVTTATAVAGTVEAKAQEVANTTAKSAKDLVNKAADAATKAGAVVKQCDLKCFKECLELKNYAPYDVIETCVTKKCSCDVSIKSKEALELISTMDLANLNSQGGVGFFGFLWRFIFICLIGVGLFFGMRKLLDYLDEKTFTKP